MNATLKDRLGSIFMLAFIALLWFQRDYTTPFGGIFPDRIMIIMAIIVLATLILSFTRFRTMKDGEGKKESGIEAKKWREMAVVIVVMLLWTLLLRYAGFALSGVVGFAFISWYISGQRKDWKVAVKAVSVGLAITFLIVYIFGYLLKVPLPRGELFG